MLPERKGKEGVTNQMTNEKWRGKIELLFNKKKRTFRVKLKREIKKKTHEKAEHMQRL